MVDLRGHAMPFVSRNHVLLEKDPLPWQNQSSPVKVAPARYLLVSLGFGLCKPCCLNALLLFKEGESFWHHWRVAEPLDFWDGMPRHRIACVPKPGVSPGSPCLPPALLAECICGFFAPKHNKEEAMLFFPPPKF